MTNVSKKFRQRILKEFRQVLETSIDALLTKSDLSPKQRREVRGAFYKTAAWKRHCAAVGQLTIEKASAALVRFEREAGPALRKILSEGAKRLPHARGGRPKLLSPSQEAQACAEIGELLGRGVRLPDAQERVAQRFKVRPRTIQRAWQANFRRQD